MHDEFSRIKAAAAALLMVLGNPPQTGHTPVTLESILRVWCVDLYDFGGIDGQRT